MSKPQNLYERNGVFYARIQIAGSDRRISLKTKDRAEAKRKLKAFLSDNSEYHGTIRRSFDDVVDAFLLEAKSRLKEKTYRRYEVSALQLAVKFSGMWWEQVTKATVVEYIDERKAAGIKIPTIKRDLTVLSQAAEFAMERQFGGANPVAQLGKRQLRHTRWVFTRPDAWSIEATIAAAYGNLSPLASFLHHTGMRLDEAATLRWAQVDPDRRTATLYNTKSFARAVSLNEPAMAVLKAQPRTTEWVFPTKLGTPYKQASTNWQEAKRSAQKSAQKEKRKYTPFRLHDLRHIYAIEYLAAGGNLYALQKQLGHSTIRQTEEYLQFLSPEEAARAKNGVGTNPGTEAAVCT